jgi:integrase/recombinase XerD
MQKAQPKELAAHNSPPMPPWSEPAPEPEPSPEKKPICSYVESNRMLAEAFDRYQMARGQSANTLRAYHESVAEFLASLGSESVLEADRKAIRLYQSALMERGLCASTISLRTAALRAFFKFLAVTGLTRGQNPTLLLSHRKLPRRLPRVLTVAEVEKLIAAAQSPVEAAIVEVLYATGVRVSELCALRFENVDFGERVIRVKKGKGGRDRDVLFGSKAADALRRYLDRRKPKFLFEVLPGVGKVYRIGNGRPNGKRKYWMGVFVDKVEHRPKTRYIGKVSDLPTSEDAMRAFRRLLEEEPGFRPALPRPYSARGIRQIISALAARAGIGHVHPHQLRRAFAVHLLEGGADLRVIQELMGHSLLSTTSIYTSLSAVNLKEIHTRCHPHAKGAENAKEK